MVHRKGPDVSHLPRLPAMTRRDISYPIWSVIRWKSCSVRPLLLRWTYLLTSRINVGIMSVFLSPFFHVCLFVFNVPSTARLFRDGTPIYCPLQRTWSSVNTPFPPPGIEPRVMAWQPIMLPLHHASSTLSYWNTSFKKLNHRAVCVMYFQGCYRSVKCLKVLEIIHYNVHLMPY